MNIKKTILFVVCLALIGGTVAGLQWLKQHQRLGKPGIKAMPTDDPLFGKGMIRVDGRKIHPAYLFEVKKPSESKGPWDLYKLQQTIPADKAFRPLNEGNCPLVKS